LIFFQEPVLDPALFFAAYCKVVGFFELERHSVRLAPGASLANCEGSKSERLTIGLDLGDKSDYYCALDTAEQRRLTQFAA
jgi:hypothetical protein